MFQPSPKWTDQDRRIVSTAIGIKMTQESNEHSLVSGHRLYEYGDRLRLVGTAGDKFLEANRSQILEGLDEILKSVTAA